MRAAADRKQKPVWALWANPIFRRYCKSRLRPKGLGVMLMMTLIVTGFAFALARAIALHELDPIDAARIPVIPILVIQGIILFFLGTGQVAGGMTAEGDEGVIDYQRLAPMSPLAKTFGYLFGLPIREYVLFLSTLPFTIWSFWEGQIPLFVAGQLYGGVLSSVILYHLTGLVAGTVLKNRRWAFLVSMGAIFFLYTVVPQIAKFGLVYFKYLTLYPIFEESLPYLVPQDAGAVVETAQRLLPPARFFNLNLPQAVFTFLSQGVFSLAAVVMVWRRWKLSESHLLGKVWSVALFAWIQILLLGNALPLIAGGDLFPSRNLGGMFNRFVDPIWEPEAMEAVLMAGVYGVVTLTLLLILLVVITPEYDTQVRGWRRVHKLGQKRLPFFGDSSSSFWWAGVMILLGTIGWFVFTKNIIESHWFFGEVKVFSAVAFALSLVTAGFGWQAILEWKGRRAGTLVFILLGVVPILIGVVMAVSNEALRVPAIWIGSISPLAGPVLAAINEVSIADFPRDVERAAPPAFWFWQCLLLFGAVRLIASSRQQKKALREVSVQ
ncbi:hypothetical protein AAFN60_01030 [Roseibacillus persicicus]|uniref:hypothetical protein n=1 Tax=Roseibacillus persicicus TaxID=454148 RepID=UPI00398ADB96